MSPALRASIRHFIALILVSVVVLAFGEGRAIAKYGAQDFPVQAAGDDAPGTVFNYAKTFGIRMFLQSLELLCR